VPPFRVALEPKLARLPATYRAAKAAPETVADWLKVETPLPRYVLPRSESLVLYLEDLEDRSELGNVAWRMPGSVHVSACADGARWEPRQAAVPH